jgi:hypothetical protein
MAVSSALEEHYRKRHRSRNEHEVSLPGTKQKILARARIVGFKICLHFFYVEWYKN